MRKKGTFVLPYFQGTIEDHHEHFKYSSRSFINGGSKSLKHIACLHLEVRTLKVIFGVLLSQLHKLIRIISQSIVFLLIRGRVHKESENSLHRMLRKDIKVELFIYMCCHYRDAVDQNVLNFEIVYHSFGFS